MEKSTGKTPEGLALPDVPESVAYLWGIYNDIYRGSTLTYAEIYYYCALTGLELVAPEVSTLMDLDATRRLVQQQID